MSPPPTLIPASVSLDAACEGSSSINFDTIDDIGMLLQSMPQSTVRNLTSVQKYSILVNHFKPSRDFKFPSQYADGCNRSCQYKYFVDYPWFVYSIIEDGIYCLPCVLFASKDDLGKFVCEKFNAWSKKTRKFAEHNSTKYHKLALVRMEALKSSITQPQTAIDNRLQAITDSQIASNRYIIKCLADTVLVCGQQCVALRGHRDDSTAPKSCNKGNFHAFLSYSIRSGNVALEKHLKEASRNALYTSKTVQNDLIECIGDHIRGKLITEVKGAKWYSVLCDEVTDVSNKEQISVVVRFVDSTFNIQEKFLDFVETKRTTGEVLAGKIKDTLVKHGLNFQDCRGQGYDGAANMSSTGSVQGRLLAENPKAVYIHCNSHILNLCIVQACSLPAIRDMNTVVTESAYFFENSAKRQAFFEDVLNNQTSTVKVKDLCRTRWIYRHEAYEHFFVLFKYLVAAMKAIVSRDNQYGVMKWDGKTIIAANGLLGMYRSFSFIVSFIATMNLMAIVKPISIKLQSRSYDIVKAYSQVRSVIDEISAVRANDGMLHAWYMQAEAIAKEIDVTPQVPRTTGRQCHRDNTEHSSVEEYFRRTVVLPLLDNFTQQMNDRFSKTQVIASKLLDLVPSAICKRAHASLEEAASFYNGDLPSVAVVPTEVWRWRTKWLAENEDSRPSTLQAALKECDKDYFPNIHILLRIACTIPVTSCENERANSTLKNVKTFLRSSMGEERLSSLAIMSVYSDMPVDLDNVVDRFKLKSNRRIVL